MFPLGNKTAIDAVISKDDTAPSNYLACPLDNFACDKVKDIKDLYEKQLQYDFSGYVSAQDGSEYVRVSNFTLRIHAGGVGERYYTETLQYL